MTTTKIDKIGSRTALLIGLPIGFIFSSIILLISIFPAFGLGLGMIGGGLFWHPIIWAGLIPLVFGILLWMAGKRIKKHMDKNFSNIKISFLFTLFINAWLFALLFIIFVISIMFFSIDPSNAAFNISIAFGLIIFAFIVSTVFTSFTISLLIVKTTRGKIDKTRTN